jgi:hypothetical protein
MRSGGICDCLKLKQSIQWITWHVALFTSSYQLLGQWCTMVYYGLLGQETTGIV